MVLFIKLSEFDSWFRILSLTEEQNTMEAVIMNWTWYIYVVGIKKKHGMRWQRQFKHVLLYRLLSSRHWDTNQQ